MLTVCNYCCVALFFDVFGRKPISASHLLSLIFRSSSVPKSVQSRWKVGGGGEFHRVWYGGRAKDEQNVSEVACEIRRY